LSSLALSDPSPIVRSQAVSALGRLRNQEALEPLTLALADQYSSVRIQALRGIKNLKATEAIGDLQAMLANKNFTFVNVHIPYEGEIQETDAFIPFDEVEARLGEFPQARDARIVVYCRSGSMSAIASRALVRAGYTDIYNLDGGFRAWSAAGYSLIQK